MITLLKELVDGEVELEWPLRLTVAYIQSKAGGRKSGPVVLEQLKAKAGVELALLKGAVFSGGGRLVIEVKSPIS